MANLRNEFFLYSLAPIPHSIAGSITPTGALATQTNPSPGGNDAISVGGTITPTGKIEEFGVGFSEESGVMAGEITPTSTLNIQLTTILRKLQVSGEIEPTGSLETHRPENYQELAGSITPSGLLYLESTGPAAITVEPSSATIAVGFSVQLNARVYNANGTVNNEAEVIWSSNDEDVATVDGDGLVVGVSVGSCVVTGSVGSIIDTVAISVVPYVAPSPTGGGSSSGSFRRRIV